MNSRKTFLFESARVPTCVLVIFLFPLPMQCTFHVLINIDEGTEAHTHICDFSLREQREMAHVMYTDTSASIWVEYISRGKHPINFGFIWRREKKKQNLMHMISSIDLWDSSLDRHTEYKKIRRKQRIDGLTFIIKWDWKSNDESHERLR